MLARRRETGDWRLEQPLTLREWIESGEPLSTADIDLHLSMLFPPVRPQGYLEIRYLDAQPGDEWIAPLALLAALFAGSRQVRQVLRCCAEGADRWQQATEQGLADPVLRGIAAQLFDIAAPGLDGLGLPPAVRDERRPGAAPPALRRDQSSLRVAGRSRRRGADGEGRR